MTAEQEDTIVRLQDNYYHDSFGKVIFIITALLFSIAFLVAISLYIFMNQPPPTTFRVAEEWRVVAPVPIQQPYLSEPDLLQWVSQVVPSLFEVDFLHYDNQLDEVKQYFTENGYQVFLKQLSNFDIDKKRIQSYKAFTQAEPTLAPIILNQGVLLGRYAWWVQIPINISYAGARDLNPLPITLQVLVVRTETTNNLVGILIDNVIVKKDEASSLTGIIGR